MQKSQAGRIGMEEVGSLTLPQPQQICCWWPPGDALARRLGRGHQAPKAGRTEARDPAKTCVCAPHNTLLLPGKEVLQWVRGFLIPFLPRKHFHPTFPAFLCGTAQLAAKAWSPGLPCVLVLGAFLGTCEWWGWGPHGVRGKLLLCHKNQQVLIAAPQL